MTDFRVLLVDDEQTKAQMIGRALNDCVDGLYFNHVSNASVAREELLRGRYDLVLIDINLPDLVDGSPSPMGGFDLFDLLQFEANRLGELDYVFVTARDDISGESRKGADSRGVSLCAVSANVDDWKIFLKSLCKRLRIRSSKRQSSNVDIAIITAMRSPELEAVLRLPFHWEARRYSGDPTSYQFGSVIIGGVTIRLVAASAMNKGLAASAALTAKIATRMEPRLVMMLGICAGVKEKVSLGDIVLANSTWDWGSGKHAQGNDGSVVFKTGALQSVALAELIEIAVDVAEDSNTRRSIRAGWSRNVPQGELHIRCGPMASGASVLAHSGVVEEIVNQNRDLLAVEMEAYAVMSAAASCGAHGLAIKSICDFADAAKSDDWQEYAAYTSVAFFEIFLSRIASWLKNGVSD